MSPSIILQFIKSFWKEISIATLLLTVFVIHMNNNLLKADLAVSKQETTNIRDKLEISNATVTQLQAIVDTQNQKLTEISTIEQTKARDSKLKLLEAKQTNVKLQEQLKELQEFQESGNMCEDIGKILRNVGE